MFLSEQEYDRLARVRQDLQACQEENRRLREALEEAHGYLMHDEPHEATVWIEQALESGDE